MPYMKNVQVYMCPSRPQRGYRIPPCQNNPASFPWTLTTNHFAMAKTIPTPGCGTSVNAYQRPQGGSYWFACGRPSSSITQPANMIWAFESFGNCPEVRNIAENIDCDAHNGGSVYIFADGHVKWYRLGQTLQQGSCLWADDPGWQNCICGSYLRRIMLGNTVRRRYMIQNCLGG